MRSSATPPQVPSYNGDSETKPLIQSMEQSTMGMLATATVVGVLAVAWCIVDAWNRETSSALFDLGEVKKLALDSSTGDIKADFQNAFSFPLMLAFLQFVFMGIVFAILWKVFSRDPEADLAGVRATLGDKRWPMMAVTHVFSTFWLQSLMMPTQMMSLGIFAASRAVEIPTAALARSQVLGVRFGGHSLTTSALMFSAAWLLFYSYSQIAECLCVWSGHGVALSGPALYMIYALVLTIPVLNAVCQEAAMVQMETNPLLMLALQNIFACAVFLPILLGAHLVGWENIGDAARAIVTAREVCLLVVWLCISMAVFSGIGAALIYNTDSFWAVTLRSMRVVWWWGKELILFYWMSDTLLSIARPSASFWSFVMLCALALGSAAVILDHRAKEHLRDEHYFGGRQTAWKAV